MDLFISIVGAIVAIFVIILLHELGHFFVARAFGVKILKFSIGFGKAMVKRTGKDGTEYVLALFPLGGYVKMLGEHEAKEIAPAERHRAFNRKPLLVRMAVVLAGPMTNFILGLFVFWAVYLIGVAHVKPIVGKVIPNSIAAKAQVQPGDYILQVNQVRTYDWQQVMTQLFLHMGDEAQVPITVIPKQASKTAIRQFNLSSWRVDSRKPDIFKSIGMYGYIPPIPAVIKRVMPNSPAAKAKLRSGDKIISINAQSVNSWGQVVALINQNIDKKIKLGVLRDGVKKSYSLMLGHQLTNKKRGYLGVMVMVPKIPNSMIYKEKYNFFTAWVPAARKTWGLIKYNALVLVKLITLKLSFKLVGGPISIFQAAGQATHAGIEVYLNFIGFISLAVGFINLLPIPGLDGGVFLFQVVEAVIRRPVPERIQAIGFTLGMLFVIFIVLNATVNDLYRLFG